MGVSLALSGIVRLEAIWVSASLTHGHQASLSHDLTLIQVSLLTDPGGR